MKTGEIAKLVSGTLSGDPDVELTSVADIYSADSSEIAFADSGQIPDNIKAGCVIVPNDVTVPGPVTSISVRNPKLAFARVAEALLPKRQDRIGIHPSSVISQTARIASGVSIGCNCFIDEDAEVGEGTQIRAGTSIGRGVRIGKNCVIHPNVSIEDGCTIGNNVVLHSGVVIGADGFGYVREEAGEYIKFPQIGTVVIEDDVEIGANSCVDRGALDETRIGAGTKIDNLVQIAHNVQIGKRVVIAAQTGISGSTVIEDDCVIGGQVGMGDHARVLAGAIIGSQAGILPGKIVRPGVWWGTPVQPLDEYKRQNAHVKGLGRLKEEIKELKKQLAELLRR